MTRFRFVFSAIVLLVGAGVLVSTTVDSRQRKGKGGIAGKEAQIKRGQYLVTICACNDCHSPKLMTPMGPMPDTSRLLSGHPAGDSLPSVPPGLIAPAPDKWGAITNNHLTAWVGPWGTSFTANLTPDVETGLGSWTEDMFVHAIRTGKHMGTGRQILPPMPWPMYGQMTSEDLSAVFAYLKSLPPVSNAVSDPMTPTGEKIPTPRVLK